MPFELEALVGHLYIVGGRAIRTTPPGAVVEVAPKKATRGRETDTFFALVVPSGSVAPTTFYDQMALLSTERYFNASGSVTAAIRNVFTTLNQNLYEHNTSGGQHYEASIICAVMRGYDLYIGRVGPAMAVLQHNGKTITFPGDMHNDEALFKPPLGVQPIPEVKMSRYRINKGSRLVLGDVNLAEQPTERITNAMVAINLEAMLDGLKAMVTTHAQVMAVEFVPPDEQAAVPVATGESTTKITTELAAVRAKTRTQEMNELAAQKNKSTVEVIQKHAKKSIGNAAKRTAQGVNLLGKGVEKVFPEPKDKEEQKQMTAGAVRTAVVAIPLVIMAAVVLLWVSNIGGSQFEVCLTDAEGVAHLARNIDSSDRTGVIGMWQATLEKIRECDEFRENDSSLNALRQEGQQVIDTLNNIKRRQAIPLVSFPDARIRNLALQGLDLYALDETSSLVYHVQIGADGMSAARSEPLPNMRQGATVDGITLGEIIDIAFDEQANAIVALDRAGVLVRCDPRIIMQCEAQRVIAAENWQNPVAITLWQGRLYVLDVGSGLLWRYEPSGGSYASMPTEYFEGQQRPNLENAVDFDITTGGTVYFLYSEGVMTSHFGGQAQPFGFSAFPEGQELHTYGAQAIFLNDSPINTGFFIVSRSIRTVFETTLAGTFVDAYRIFEEEKFALLSAVVADPGQEIFYAASGNTIFSIAQG